MPTTSFMLSLPSNTLINFEANTPASTTYAPKDTSFNLTRMFNKMQVHLEAALLGSEPDDDAAHVLQMSGVGLGHEIERQDHYKTSLLQTS